MQNNKRSILVFGGSDYQLSLIKECKKMSLFTVVVDPNPEAVAQKWADVFEVVGGQDFDGTCAVVERYKIDAVITAATDKPLVMMARIAKKYGMNFFSEETAIISTDKFQMKERFLANGLPCAKGRLITQIPDDFNCPIVIKPRDNSGSRGVIFCDNRKDANQILEETKKFTRLETVLAEEVVEGKEYSIESLHYNGITKVLQITEKIVTPLPYYIELGHVQPADISDDIRAKIEEMVHNASQIFNFNNCGSHNEVKINNGKITFIEVSPRIGGDFISSTLVLLSTGINMERALIEVVLGIEPTFEEPKPAASGVFFFDFPEGVIRGIKPYDHIKSMPGVYDFRFDLKPGDRVPSIKLGTDRYGYVLLQAKNRDELFTLRDKVFREIKIDYA